MAQTINISTARQDFSKIVNDVFKEKKQIVVEKSGIPVAAIISADELKRFQQMEQEREARFKLLDGIKTAFEGISASEIENETDKAVQEVRTDLHNAKSND